VKTELVKFIEEEEIIKRRGRAEELMRTDEAVKQPSKLAKRVLIVDDEADVNTALREVLELNGFKVDAYEDPLLALENFKPHFYELLILDIKMPDLNGFALYREIKKLDKEVKLCFLTAGEMYYGDYSDIFSSLPANCFIRKPVDNEELIKRITEIIGNPLYSSESE
jgi:two-component system, OmpR family, response regulator ChvI